MPRFVRNRKTQTRGVRATGATPHKPEKKKRGGGGVNKARGKQERRQAAGADSRTSLGQRPHYRSTTTTTPRPWPVFFYYCSIPCWCYQMKEGFIPWLVTAGPRKQGLNKHDKTRKCSKAIIYLVAVFFAVEKDPIPTSDTEIQRRRVSIPRSHILMVVTFFAISR